MAEPDREFRTPGQLLRHLLEENGWTRRVLAIVLGVEEPVVSRMVTDLRPIDAERAIQLSEVFGIPAERFLELQRSYDLARARLKNIPDPARSTRAQIFGSLPVTEMITRGWLDVEDMRDVPRLEREIASFFGVANVGEVEILPHAAKKTNVDVSVTPTQLAWLYRARRMAAAMVVPKYSTQALAVAIEKMRGLLASPQEARRVPRLLAEAGVRFVVVESLKSGKIDGACMWLDDRSPVIALSMRFDRMDNFWFVLRHECEHVLRGHGRDRVALDAELERGRAGTGDDVDAQERMANEAAADFCVPSKQLKGFVSRKAPLFAERDIIAFSRMIGVHPGLIAGQLQHATGRYERFRNHITTIRDVVLPNVLHDGWGDVAPIDLFQGA